MENFYINSQSKLNKVLALVKSAKIFALDTEFTRETTYYPILSIIQIAVKNRAGIKESFIIDCLCDLDLTEFLAIISDKKIIKILHSSSQDLQIFYHKSQEMPQSIFDTQVMANFCGLDFGSGYSYLVKLFFNQELDKQQQRSDWQMRPLSKKQIDYALLDVFFLEEIYQNLLKNITQKQRFDWLQEEMQNFVKKSLIKSDDALSKKFSFRGKSESQIRKIKNLILWRESWAQKINVPRQHFVKDEVLLEIVDGHLEAWRAFNSEMKKELNDILDGLCQIYNHEQEEKILPMTQKQKNNFSEGKSLIAKIAKSENFHEQFLVTSADLKKIICNQDSFDSIIFGWRKELFGKELQQLIS